MCRSLLATLTKMEEGCCVRLSDLGLTASWQMGMPRRNALLEAPVIIQPPKAVQFTPAEVPMDPDKVPPPPPKALREQREEAVEDTVEEKVTVEKVTGAHHRF